MATQSVLFGSCPWEPGWRLLAVPRDGRQLGGFSRRGPCAHEFIIKLLELLSGT